MKSDLRGGQKQGIFVAAVSPSQSPAAVGLTPAWTPNSGTSVGSTSFFEKGESGAAETENAATKRKRMAWKGFMLPGRRYMGQKEQQRSFREKLKETTQSYIEGRKNKEREPMDVGTLVVALCIFPIRKLWSLFLVFTVFYKFCLLCFLHAVETLPVRLANLVCRI